MKKLLMLTIVLFSILAVKVNAQSIYNRDIDINVFYGALEPYGEWIEIGYDDYVWRPYNSDYDWRPYGDGRWEWTRNGWYWESYEPFGWATYHYGRWYNDDYYGWVWMPDNVWAPAWVEWRYNDDYIGWAPLPPYASFNSKYGIHFSIKWNSGFVYWNFVKYNHFNAHNIHDHFVHTNYVKNVFNKTKYRTNYFTDNNRIVNGGISRTYIERKIGTRFTTRVIKSTNNYSVYNSKDRKTRTGIVEYRPSDTDIRSRSFDKTKVTKGRTLNSLRTDKVEISKRTVEKSNNTPVIKEREINKSSNNESVNRSGRVIDRNTDTEKGTTVERKVIKKETTDRTENNSGNYSRDVINNNSRTKSLPNTTESTISKSVNKREVIKRTENNTNTESKVNSSRSSVKKETSSTVKSESKSRK